MPTMREATVTKKKPKTMISTPSSSRPKKVPGMKGSTAMISTRPTLPPTRDGERQVVLGALLR